MSTLYLQLINIDGDPNKEVALYVCGLHPGYK